MPRARFVLTHADGTESSGEGDVAVDDGFLMLQPGEGPSLAIPYEQVVALDGQGFAIRLVLEEGATLVLSHLGQMHGDVLARVREARKNAWEKGLFLHGVRLVDTFTATAEWEKGAGPVEVRLYEDRLSVLPEAGDPVGVPYALAGKVKLDPHSYRVSVSADGMPLSFGMLKQRTTESQHLLADLISASRARTASLLARYLPELPLSALSALSAVMGDGIAARREEVDRLAPGAWQRLERLVVRSEELSATYQFLAGQAAAADVALGMKQTRASGEEGPDGGEPGGAPQPDDGGDDTPGEQLVTWFFCPVRRGDGGFIAQEITSESGHATYFFRVSDCDWERELTRFNRAMLSLNFKRRPIFEGGDEAAGYAFAMKHLPYLRDLRTAFAGRAIHTTFEAWKASAERILGS